MAGGAPDYYHLQYRVTTTAGISASASLTTQTAVRNQILDAVLLRFPPGSNGLMGFRMLWTGVQLLPWGTGPDWITGNNEQHDFPVGLEIGSQLVIQTYNLDVLTHDLIVRLQVHELPHDTGLTAVQPLSTLAIDDAAAGLG